MNILEKHEAVKKAATGCHISGGDLRKGYRYGENPFADMQIENALFCDMFPEDVPDPKNYYGFSRSAYSLSHTA